MNRIKSKVLAWIVQNFITILISKKNYGKKRNEPFQGRKNKSKRSRHVRNRMRKISRIKKEFLSEEDAKDYIENMIDWDMLVTIVGQLSEHITEKKVNEMLNNK